MQRREKSTARGSITNPNNESFTLESKKNAKLKEKGGVNGRKNA